MFDRMKYTTVPWFVSSRHRVYHREDKSGFVIERNARRSFLFVADPSVRIWRFILPQPPNPCRPARRILRTGVNGARNNNNVYAQQNHLRSTPATGELSLSPLLPTPLPSTMFLSVTVYRISKLKRMARLVVSSSFSSKTRFFRGVRSFPFFSLELSLEKLN